ncbi:MAG: SUMF1/EgtB/PvdO family nonheme iron enzyme, partial [Kiritimatiellia bacterium]
AFYCMKYEITQGQYAAFLNALTSVECGGQDNTGQTADRYYKPATLANRYSLTGFWPAITAGKPYVACNNLSWADDAAYAAWAGLRPMTELEFEKACRGPIVPVAGEYAWGSTAISQATGISNDGAVNETASNSGANCAYGNHGSVQGPLRAGVFATSTSDRAGSGASYWGIMELSGNLWERVVTIGNGTGQGFQGTHGAGTLTLPADWPQANAVGAGFRGGSWDSAATGARVSDRASAASTWAARDSHEGSRGVRAAP